MTLLSLKKSHVSHHIFITACAQNVSPLAVDASFQFVDVRGLGSWYDTVAPD